MGFWQYKVVEFDAKSSFMGGLVDVKAMEETLNRLGQEGWEVINGFTTNQGNGYTRKIVYTLKKEERF